MPGNEPKATSLGTPVVQNGGKYLQDHEKTATIGRIFRVGSYWTAAALVGSSLLPMCLVTDLQQLHLIALDCFRLYFSEVY